MPCTLICFFKSASFDCSSQYARYRGDSGRKQQRTKKMDVRAMASTAGCSLVEKSRKCCDQNIMYVIWLVCRNCMKYVSEIGWCGEALWAIYVLQKTWNTFSRVRWCITHSHIKPFCTQRNRIFGVLSLNFVMVGFFGVFCNQQWESVVYVCWTFNISVFHMGRKREWFCAIYFNNFSLEHFWIFHLSAIADEVCGKCCFWL